MKDDPFWPGPGMVLYCWVLGLFDLGMIANVVLRVVFR